VGEGVVRLRVGGLGQVVETDQPVLRCTQQKRVYKKKIKKKKRVFF
jgi:hypothetical protein